jgi:hypothetical protein
VSRILLNCETNIKFIRIISVEQIERMFAGAVFFNQDLAQWHLDSLKKQRKWNSFFPEQIHLIILSTDFLFSNAERHLNHNS